MSGTGIDLRDDLSPLLARIQTEAEIANLNAVVGRAAVNETRQHLFDLNASRHRYGRNYYAGAARGTSFTATPAGPRLSVNQVGIRQRRFGGVIRPKSPRRFLTIPADPSAMGLRAREFNDLDVERVYDPETSRLRWALVRRASTALKFARRKQKDGSYKVTVRAAELRAGGTIMFWLVRKVEQAADPTVLPSNARLVEIARTAALARFTRLANRKNLPPSAAPGGDS